MYNSNFEKLSFLTRKSLAQILNFYDVDIKNEQFQSQKHMDLTFSALVLNLQFKSQKHIIQILKIYTMSRINNSNVENVWLKFWKIMTWTLRIYSLKIYNFTLKKMWALIV